MTTGIEKYKIDNKIVILYYKYRGNLVKVSEESGIPLEYVKKITGKIKRRRRRDVDFLVAGNIMEYILMGSQQRVQYLTHYLDFLEKRDTAILSVCCSSPVEKQVKYGKEKYTCLKCEKECKVKVVDKLAIVNIIHKTIELLREEDKSLVEFADKLGFTNKEPTPVERVTQYNVVFPQGSKGGTDLGKEDQLLKDIRNLRPAEREKIRKRIESKIVEKSKEK